MGKLDGKVAIITGSDSGIGQAMAEEFAREGADVAVTYFHDRNGAEETGRRVKACGRRAVVAQVDVRRGDHILRLFEETETALGTPFILVNNAGIGFSGKTVAEMSDEEWDNEIRTNLYGPFLCSREFIRRRRMAGGRGKIINITSVHEDIPSPAAAGYNAAKGGLRNLTRTLALELAADCINVNNIAPGMILTPMNQEAVENEEVRRRREAAVPWKRAGRPEEVAKLGLFLASDDSNYVTGASYFIDGGLMMNMGQGA